MKTYQIAVMKGDGIGEEIVNESLKILDVIEERGEVRFECESLSIGADSIRKYGVPLTEETLTACRKSNAILFGAIGDPEYDNSPDLSIRPEQGLLKLRKEMGLYANVRPVQIFESLIRHSPLKEDRIKGVDFIIYRELTGGIYFGEKGINENGVAYDHCFYSVLEIDRIVRKAFESAEGRNKKLTLVDKANVLETSRLWRKCTQRLSKEFPNVIVDYLFVDNAAMQIILNPCQFDVIVTENMFGDILSDEASVIGGSIGLMPSASYGDHIGLFEPIHGSYPQAKGLNKANPIASILSTAMMLSYLGLSKEAKEIEVAVEKTIEKGILTEELQQEAKGCSTAEVGNAIVNELKK